MPPEGTQTPEAAPTSGPEPRLRLSDRLTVTYAELSATRIGKSTLRRWAGLGLRGVRLETIKVGARRCTSREALQRFVRRLTEATDREDGE